MNSKNVIAKYFEAYKALDANTMQGLYAKNARYQDPVFGTLENIEIGYLCQFLCKHAQEFKLTIDDIQEKDQEIRVAWRSQYRFAATGRPVENSIESCFLLDRENIIFQKDIYDLKKWVKQAFGSATALLNSDFILKKIVQVQAKKQLKKHIKEYPMIG